MEMVDRRRVLGLEYRRYGIEISAGEVALLNNGLGMSWLSWLFWKITFIGHFGALTIIVLDSISGAGPEGAGTEVG